MLSAEGRLLRREPPPWCDGGTGGNTLNGDDPGAWREYHTERDSEVIPIIPAPVLC
jgi:hypothetical protein